MTVRSRCAIVSIVLSANSLKYIRGMLICLIILDSLSDSFTDELVGSIVNAGESVRRSMEDVFSAIFHLAVA
jgi:hypothetical protein